VAARKFSKGWIHSREHKSISIHPIRIFGVKDHEFVEEDMSGRSQTHGSSRVTGVCCKGCIDLDQKSERVRMMVEPVPRASEWKGIKGCTAGGAIGNRATWPTYSKDSNGVDTQLVKLAVTHDCDCVCVLLFETPEPRSRSNINRKVR
jgi:hypothetical protein